MTFTDDLRRFQVKVTSATKEVVATIIPALHKSITEGSPLTGSPGQPVDTGYLIGSWQYEFAPDLSGGIIGTDTAYAPVIEYGLRSKYDPKGKVPDRETSPGAGVRQKTSVFGPLALSLGDSGYRMRSNVGGIGSVRLTVANADRVLAEAVRQVTR